MKRVLVSIPSMALRCAITGAIALGAITLCGTAHAKAVRVKWKPLEGAVKYELQVSQGDRIVAKETLSSELTLWRGKLSPGYYHYQLRAIDRFDRPGDWSAPKAIIPPMIWRAGRISASGSRFTPFCSDTSTPSAAR